MEHSERGVLKLFNTVPTLTADFANERFPTLFVSPDARALVSVFYNYRRQHGSVVTPTVYEDIVATYLNGRGLDTETVLQKTEQLRDIYRDVMEAPVGAEDAPGYWMDQLRDLAGKKRLENLIGALQAHQASGSVTQALDLMATEGPNLRAVVEGMQISEPISAKSYAPDELADYRRRRDTQDWTGGITTGWAPLDAAIGKGFEAGEILVATARSGVGKSIALNSFAVNAFAQGNRVAVINVEMNRVLAMKRFYAAALGVPYMGLRTGRFSEYEDEREALERQLTEGLRLLPQLEGDLWFFQDHLADLGVIRVELERLRQKTQEPIDLIVLDYLNILRPDKAAFTGVRLRGDELQQMNIEQARDLGAHFDCPVYTAAQLNREGVESKLKGRDAGGEIVSGSDYIVNTADAVFRLYRDEEDVRGHTISCHPMKVRNGECPERFRLAFAGAISYMYWPEMAGTAVLEDTHAG